MSPAPVEAGKNIKNVADRHLKTPPRLVKLS